MLKFKLVVENFLAVKKAEVETKNNIVVLVAPNKAGKTQLLFLLYTIFWSFWKVEKDKSEFPKIFKQKIKNVFLIKEINELKMWDKKSNVYINLSGNLINLEAKIDKNLLFKKFEKEDITLCKPPIYISPGGFGDYYKGIFSLKKYYPEWRLVSEAVTDFVNDLFLLPEVKVDSEYKEELKLFEKLFFASYFVQNQRIYIQEKEKKYSIEKTASGLKSLSWLYLILKYNLLSDIIFLDEPEVNLHPEFLYKFVLIIEKLAEKEKKIFIATHSDYLLESLNTLIAKKEISVDVWEGKLSDKGATYSSYVADKENQIDVSPLSDVYLDILKKIFEV